MEPVEYQVNLETLTVTFTVTPGMRVFSIIVKTSIGLTFTDSVEIEVVWGAPIALNFNLAVNAPPSITEISASPAGAKPGDLISLFCSATDLDAEDSLSYRWAGSEGWTATGQEASYTIPSYGMYTFTCTVDDGWGGVASESVLVNACQPSQYPPHPPYRINPDADNGWGAAAGRSPMYSCPSVGYPGFVRINPDAGGLQGSQGE